MIYSWISCCTLFRADPEKGPVNKNIDYGLQANIAIDIVKAMFAETACK